MGGKVKEGVKRNSQHLDVIITTLMKSRSQRAAQIDTSQCIKPALGVTGDAVSEGKNTWMVLAVHYTESGKMSWKPLSQVGECSTQQVKCLQAPCWKQGFPRKSLWRKPTHKRTICFSIKSNRLPRDPIWSHLPATKLGNDATFFVCWEITKRMKLNNRKRLTYKNYLKMYTTLGWNSLTPRMAGVPKKSDPHSKMVLWGT